MSDQMSGPAGASDAAGASADTGTGAAQSDGFDARQAVLNHRSAENNYDYAVAVHDCYSKFFVNYCIDKARDKMRTVQADIRKEQLGLDGEERTARAQQRDEKTALQRAQDEAKIGRASCRERVC